MSSYAGSVLYRHWNPLGLTHSFLTVSIEKEPTNGDPESKDVACERLHKTGSGVFEYIWSFSPIIREQINICSELVAGGAMMCGPSVDLRMRQQEGGEYARRFGEYKI